MRECNAVVHVDYAGKRKGLHDDYDAPRRTAAACAASVPGGGGVRQRGRGRARSAPGGEEYVLIVTSAVERRQA